MPNGFYDYNDEDIYKLLNRMLKEKQLYMQWYQQGNKKPIWKIP